MPDPIVIQLQTDCLDASVPISTLLRKAKLIASKLSLEGTEEWLESELNGYRCALNDLPSYRKGVGQPKFFNPYHGWLDIVLTDSSTREMVSSAFLPQAIAELEHLASGEGQFVIFGFMPPISDFLHKTLEIEFNCGLHVSKTVLIGALEGVKNSVLEWAMQLEAKGIVGEGVSFSSREKERAQTVTNHIYGRNIGVLGNVAGDAVNTGFFNAAGEPNQTKLLDLVQELRKSIGGLPEATASEMVPAIDELEACARNGDASRVRHALKSIRSIAEGAAGSIVASGILGAISG